MDEMRRALDEALLALGLDVPEDTRTRLCAFGDAVVRGNTLLNLTAITQPAQVAQLHLADSLTLLKCASMSGHTLLDMGCGAGFPGVPLAIACPELHVTLLDSLGKRMRWLEGTLPEIGISNARCITARAEEFVVSCRERYDFAASRAVARLNVLLELTAPYVRVGGAVLAMKGAAAYEELREAEGAVKRLSLRVEDVRNFPVGDAVHTVIVLRKTAPTPPQYPRRYAKIKQSPL